MLVVSSALPIFSFDVSSSMLPACTRHRPVTSTRVVVATPLPLLMPPVITEVTAPGRIAGDSLPARNNISASQAIPTAGREWYVLIEEARASKRAENPSPMTSLGHQLQIAEHSPTAPAVVKRALRLQGIPEIRGRVPKQSDHNCPSLLACQPDHHKQHTDRGQSCDQHQRYGDHEVLQGRLRVRHGQKEPDLSGPGFQVVDLGRLGHWVV